MKKLLFVLAAFVFFVSCSQNVEPIEYGEELCAYCSMTIVDQGHAAQVVTKKGKNFKFDATECMIQYLDSEDNEGDMLHILAADYLNPGNMIDVKSATFIISENIPSPMGAFLSATANKSDAEILLNDKGGELFTWDKVKGQIAGSMHMGH